MRSGRSHARLCGLNDIGDEETELRWSEREIDVCLRSDYFDEREEAKRKYELKGEIDLEVFLEEHRLTEKALVRAGLLKGKHIVSTADLSDYEVSETGKRYLREVKRHQLRMIRNKRCAALLAQVLEQRGT